MFSGTRSPAHKLILRDGHGKVRRYREGFSPIAAFADPDNPEFKTLERFCEPGDSFYCDGWSGPKPKGWDIKAESTMFKMLWNEASPIGDDAMDAVKIGPQHREQVLELVELTRPGPFGPKTIELGDYFGIFDGKRPGRDGR